MTYHIARMKDKKHMIISTGPGKAFEKILIHDNNSQQISYRRNAPHTVKVICDKPTGNIILTGEQLKAFPLISRTRMDTLSIYIQHSTCSLRQSN